MFKNWSKLFTTECNVIEVNNFTVYPIFRVGWTSLNSVATKKHTNNEIAFCKNVVVQKPFHVL